VAEGLTKTHLEHRN